MGHRVFDAIQIKIFLSSSTNKTTVLCFLPFSLMVSLVFAHNHGYPFVRGGGRGESRIIVSMDVQAGH